MSKLLERGAAGESGEGWTEEARMQGYPWEGCPFLLCGSTVRTDFVRKISHPLRVPSLTHKIPPSHNFR
eukprot:8562691-Pyramimonas_sp.AAC.1